MVPLLYVGLFLQLGATPAAQSGPTCPTTAEVESRHRQEARLANIAIDRNILRSFPVWDQKKGQLRTATAAQNMDDSTQVLIVHLWATWCSPCKEEFPIWREVTARLNEQHHGRVRVFHVAMQNEPEQMADFVKQLGSQVPFGAKYFDRGERLTKNLQTALGNKRQPPLPMTLWLDHERIVRHAIVGPISKRITEVVDVTAQLLRVISLQEQGALGRPATDDPADVFSP